jgi:FixJ family two-component response regulator
MLLSDSAALSGSQSRVIIVDDDAAVCEALAFSLSVEGYNVRYHRTGSAAAADPDLQDCACLILDFGLPDTNGLTLLRRLRRRGVTVPAILITSNPLPWVRLRAAANNTPIIEKPLLGDGLVQAVRDLSVPASV